MRTDLEIRDQAWIDVDEAGAWYERQRPGLSVDFELCLEVGLDDIILQPEGYQVKYRGIRVHYIKRFPFGIHYILRREKDALTIIVIAVFHTRKDPNSWKKRLENI